MKQIFTQKLRFTDDNGENCPEWETKHFEEIFRNISTNKYQLMKSEVKNEGSIKVIDQGKTEILGYSDNISKIRKYL
jgi:type I restriction enzyme S subunit